jgi:EAL domain-containing protein (putative c-di-GMP-specific phosphodiesterase class I)
VDANSGQLLVREALLRWRHPVRGEIMPDQFVGLIEDIGLMHQIGAWVLRMALEQAAAWPEEIAVAVNVSGTQLSAPGFTQLVVNTLAATGIAPGRVQLEVTEGIFLGDDPATFAALETLRRLGVQLVLDDFGTGYCSFGYLRRARFAKLKIDQSFVRSAARGDGDGRAIVEAVVALAGSLDLRITAEGVESDEEAALMRQLGCDELQGFLYGRPAALGPPPDGLEASRRRSA